MAKRNELYKCELCGNIVEIMHGGAGQLICCGQPMKLMVENTADQAKEKHVPVIEKIDGGVHVKVGSVPHPMEEKHFIQWIQIFDGESKQTCFLKAGQPAEAVFKVTGDKLVAREYCNLHGLWKFE